MKKIKLLGVLMGLMVTFGLKAEQKNVLVIIADDFNHWANCMGYYPQSITPNVNSLAQEGVLFKEAYCSSPVCNPSRNAFMSGLRPSTTKFWTNSGNPWGDYIRDIPGAEDIVTLNQYFMQNGYYVYGGGKIYHPGLMGSYETDPDNWSALYTNGTGSPGGSYYAWASDNDDLFKWGAGEFDVETSNDTRLARHMANFISTYTKEEPFLVMAGLFRPHLPWNCHKQFYDMFSPDTLNIPVGYLPGDVDDLPVLPNAMDIHTEIVGDNEWKNGIRAYLANLAYADFNIGIMLDALKASDFANNTIVVFYGDHGWHLGEKDRWSKHAVYGHANHTTLIIYDPSANGNGQISTKVVSLQDIYPTLIDLCGLPDKEHLEGNSIKPLLQEPNSAAWNHPIISNYNGTDYMRTNEWSLINRNGGFELYNLEADPYEWYNLGYQADSITKYSGVADSLKHILDSIVQIGLDIREELGIGESTQEVDTSYYYIMNKATGSYLKALDVNGNFVLASDLVPEAEWRFYPVSPEQFFVENKAFDNKRLKSADGASQFALDLNTGFRVQWRANDAGDGYFYLYNMYAKTNFVSVNGDDQFTMGSQTSDYAKWKKYNPVSIKTVKSTTAREYLLYPSPATDVVNIHVLEDYLPVTICVYNAEGRQVIAPFETNASFEQLPVRDLGAGIYYFSFSSENKQVTLKHIVQ